MERADIAIIGSGIASSLALIEVLARLAEIGFGGTPTKIYIIEKSPEFWKGIPYGARSSINALTITAVHDFIHEPERALFFDWIKKNRQQWEAHYALMGGLVAERWLRDNMPLIEGDRWEELYVPRFLYGNYLEEKIKRVLRKATDKGLVNLWQLHAEAIDINRQPNHLYQISLRNTTGGISFLIAEKVVITTGSAPVRTMVSSNGQELTYVNDMYEPSATCNIQRITDGLRQVKYPLAKNILVIGSNASSIELLYLLEGMCLGGEFRELVILSTSGQLPHATSTQRLAEHPTPHLDRVQSDGGYRIEDLSGAAAADIGLALRGGANMEYVATIIGKTLKMLELLDEKAHAAFYTIHAIRLRDMFRRAGHEYMGAARKLLDGGKLVLLSGRFAGLRSGSGGARLCYTDLASGKEKIYSSPFSVVINCSGSDELMHSPSALLRNLAQKNLCKVNLSGKGFLVNEKFEASPHLYVFGPLLGGNHNQLIHFWQLENAARLTALAPHLARELV